MALPNNVTLSVNGNPILMWRTEAELDLPASTAPAQTQSPTTILASETDIVEFGLAIHAAGVFPGLTQEAIMDKMRQFSGLPLEHWQQLGANIRRRDSLKFLPRLEDSLSERNEDIKEHGRACRRPRLPPK
jgi:hypothetical protein